MPITFEVSSVSATKAKTYHPFAVGEVLPNQQDDMDFRSFGKKQEKVTYEKIRSSFDSSPKTVSLGRNSFVMSGVQAYSKHHNWVIRPDDVWLAICTQFSNYVNGKSEELRNKFVDFEGKKQLVVYGGGTLMSADYVSLSLDMTNQIAKNIKDPSVREWIMPDFTTTTQNDKMVGAVVLMAAMKNYFDYMFCLCCNLPSVTLLGEVEDWIKIRERANRLLEFDTKEQYMKEWSTMLFPVLDQFVESIKGNPDKNWWNRIAHYFGGGSGPSYLSGWITTFCVFSDKGVWRGDEKTIDIWGRQHNNEWPFVNTDQIPRGYVNVPILVDDNGVKYDTEMFAGHMSVEVLEDGTSLKPRSDWSLFVVKKQAQ